MQAVDGVGEGCSFRQCNHIKPPWGAVIGGETVWPFMSAPRVPYLYIVIAHRNRLQNLYRLLGSLSASLSSDSVQWMRACTCITLVDYNTSYTELHPAQMPSLHLSAELLNADASMVDRDRDLVRHVLRQWDGESLLLDGQRMTPIWSKAALLQGAVDAIPTPATESIFFVCDADLFVTDAVFFQTMFATTIRAQQAFVPVLWSTCFGKGLNTTPTSPAVEDNDNGFWRVSGTGMVAVFKSDSMRVSGYRVKDQLRVRYGEEDINFSRDLATTFRLHRPNMPSLLHLYHSRVEWTKGTNDGIHLPDGREVCTVQGTCTCPPGTTFREMNGEMERDKKHEESAERGAALARGDVASQAAVDNPEELLAMTDADFDAVLARNAGGVAKSLRTAAKLQLPADQRRLLHARRARAEALVRDA